MNCIDLLDFAIPGFIYNCPEFLVLVTLVYHAALPLSLLSL